MVHFEDKGMFPKVHWSILEDSERFLARIPRGLGLRYILIQRKKIYLKKQFANVTNVVFPFIVYPDVMLQALYIITLWSLG